MELGRVLDVRAPEVKSVEDDNDVTLDRDGTDVQTNDSAEVAAPPLQEIVNGTVQTPEVLEKTGESREAVESLVNTDPDRTAEEVAHEVVEDGSEEQSFMGTNLSASEDVGEEPIDAATVGQTTSARKEDRGSDLGRYGFSRQEFVAPEPEEDGEDSTKVVVRFHPKPSG